VKDRRLSAIAVVALGVAGFATTDVAVASPAGNWTGFYLGVNAGGAWGTADLNTTVTGGFGAPNLALVSSLDTLRLSPDGFTGGAQLGYNYQSGNLVWGLEADFDYFRLKDSSTVSSTFVGGGPFTVDNAVETDWLFTLRPRVGMTFGRFLPYVTGGLAVTNMKYSSSLTDLVFATSQASSVSDTLTGWTAGGGVEYALTPDCSVKAEYLYTDFGSVSMTSVGGNGAVYDQSASLKADVVRLGVNVRF
jgi:outer membrane immunogenic protein